MRPFLFLLTALFLCPSVSHAGEPYFGYVYTTDTTPAGAITPYTGTQPAAPASGMP